MAHSMIILQNPRLEFRNKDRTFERFEVIAGLESTFESEGDRHDVVVIALRGLPEADLKHLMICILPKKIIVESGEYTWSLEPSRLEATIAPTGEAKSQHGEFTKDGFKISYGLLGGSHTYAVKLEAWIVSAVKMEKATDYGLRPYRT
jgi:hypothetical protein